MRTRYLVRRTIRAIATVFGVITLTFGLIRLLPGGPFDQLRQDLLLSGMDADEVEARIETLQNIRPDAPLHEQYVNYMIALLQGNFGRSIYLGDPVAEIVASAAPWTVFVVVTSTLLMFAIGLTVGAVQAYFEGSRFDKAMSGISITMSSIPFYVLAVFMLSLFAFQLDLFPTAGTVGSDVKKELSLVFVASALYHGSLPILSYTIPSIGNQALGMRGNAIQILGNDYVRVARLRGLSSHRIATRYVARNAILPMYTGLLLLLGFRLGGTVILERIFTYPGLGYYMFQALKSNDYPLMMGTFLVITVALVIGVYVADLTYGFIDPRVSTGESHEAY